MMAGPQPQVDGNADRTTTVRLSGEVRADTLAGVRDAFDSVVGSGPLVVDLSAVTYLDGAALDRRRRLGPGEVDPEQCPPPAEEDRHRVGRLTAAVGHVEGEGQPLHRR